METILFNEKQKFKWWVFLILFFALGTVLSGIIINLFNDTPQPVGIGNSVAILFGVSVSVVLIVLFAVANLKIEIDEFYLTYQFFPFHFSKKKIHWEDVKRAYIRTYKPLIEYGGWGIRYSFKNGTAYNLSGKTGLQLELKNGKKILFGTQRQEDLQQVMQLLYDKKRVNN